MISLPSRSFPGLPSTILARLVGAALLVFASTGIGARAAQDPSPHSIEPAVLRIPPGSTPYEGDEEGPSTTLVVRYRVDEDGLASRQAIRLGFGYPTHNDWSARYRRLGGWLLGPGSSLKKLPFATMQTRDPAQAGYVRARCPELPEVEVVTQIVDERPGIDLIEATPMAPLPAGSVLEFRLGDVTQDAGGALLLRNVPGHPYLVFLRQRPGSRYYELDRGPFPRLLCTAERTDNLLVSLPINPPVGAEIEVSVLAMQGREGRRGNLIRNALHEGELRLRADPPGLLELPESARFEAGGRGALRVPARVLGPGRVVVEASLADDPAVRAISNVAVVEESPRHLYAVGDSQRHAAAGGHAAAPDEELWRQHYEMGDDYATIVQHVASELASWKMANDVARAFQDEVDPAQKQFIAFPGYEWSLRDLHHHVVYRGFTRSAAFGDKPAPHDSGEKQHWSGNLAELLSGLEGLKMPTLAIAHHTQWDLSNFGTEPYDWGPKESPVRPLVEIFSAHGASDRQYELPPGPWDYPVHWDEQEAEQRKPEEKGTVQDALAAGHRLGFVGGSDNHSWEFFRCGHRGNGRPREKYGRQGLGVVLGDPSIERLRPRIFDGLASRRTYATTGHKSYLRVEFGDAVMGEEVELEVGSELRIHAVASGVARPERARFVRVQVWRDGGTLVLDRELDDAELELSWTDPEPPVDGRHHPYYVQLFHDDHHLSWGSPIWVRYRASGEDDEDETPSPVRLQPPPEGRRGGGKG